MKEGVSLKKKKIGEYILDPAQMLGAGQYGKVYKGYHKTTNNQTAIKVIDKKQSKINLMKLMMMTILKTL